MATIQDLLKELEEFDKSAFGHGYQLRIDLGNLILEEMRARNWTQADVAQAAGMKASFINRIIHSEENCTFKVVGRLLHALGIRPRLVRDEITARSGVAGSETFINSGTTNGKKETPKWTARKRISTTSAGGTEFIQPKANQL